MEPIEAGRPLDAQVALVLGWQEFPYMMHDLVPHVKHTLGNGRVWPICYCPPGPVHVGTITDVPHFSTGLGAALDAAQQYGIAVFPVKVFAEYGDWEWHKEGAAFRMAWGAFAAEDVDTYEAKLRDPGTDLYLDNIDVCVDVDTVADTLPLAVCKAILKHEEWKRAQAALRAKWGRTP